MVTAQTTKDDGAGLTIEPWPTIIAVQRHLFPAGKNSPDADQINAPCYLQMMLNTPNFSQEERNFILNGAKRVNAVSTEIYQRLFLDLTASDKEEVLRFIETSPPGKIWLSTLLMYIFEALLSDPIYGGNPQQIGWNWLEHQPGFPRPPENKKYWMLQ
ncbi:MAG: gluconate 2-dehydrogenase subunit 3 family protein [Proteobacteria bacterium]|nr:gluconate 2-dehydrogenase subunit 3 family protein [Pseudomonadota bacterium]MBU1687862.1 gluconate 2-dehydrogenase subunit 3 family protein [Pseudomonadota bacterium]